MFYWLFICEQLKKKFPEFYDTLVSHSSYFKVLFKFIFDPNFTLQSRVVRPQSMSKQQWRELKLWTHRNLSTFVNWTKTELSSDCMRGEKREDIVCLKVPQMKGECSNCLYCFWISLSSIHCNLSWWKWECGEWRVESEVECRESKQLIHTNNRMFISCW
jgi:hypothetical protein